MLRILFIIFVIITSIFVFFIYKYGIRFLKNKLYYVPYKEHILKKPNENIKDIFIPFETKKDKKLNIHGWLFDENKEKPIILFCHGNAGNISYRNEIMNDFIKLNIPFFIFDYKGFGKSDGSTDIDSTYDDTLLCYNFLSDKFKDRKIIPIGESIGSYPASKIACEFGLDKLVLIGGINSISFIVKKKFPIKILEYLTRGDLEVGKNLELYKGETLLIHSKTDEIVPIENALKNLQCCNNPKSTLKKVSGGHNNMIYDMNILNEFINF